MNANESKSQSNEGGQLDEEEPNFESKTKAAIPYQSVTKEIYWNKKRENKLKGMYERRSILSARRQKLAAEILKKEVSKTYNIKALWQCNHDLGLNFKANTPVSELAKSSESV